MKALRLALLVLFLIASTGFLLVYRPGLAPRPDSASPRVARLGNLAKIRAIPVVNHTPLWFEPNEGQFPQTAKFGTHSRGYSIYFSENGLGLSLFQHADRTGLSHSTNVLHESLTANFLFVGANRNPKMTAVEKLPSVSNYFRGSDPKHWQTKVSNYSRLIYEDIYPGVNLICHGQQNEPEFDWIVQPGADTEHIRILVRGASPTINLAGDLVLKFTDSEVRLKKPVIYQEVGSIKRLVNGEYALSHPNEVSFRIDNFDQTRPLVDGHFIPPLPVTRTSGRSWDRHA